MEIPISKWLDACLDRGATSEEACARIAALCRDVGRKFIGDVAMNFLSVMQRKLLAKEWEPRHLEAALAAADDAQLANFLRIELEFHLKRRENIELATANKLEALLKFEDSSGAVDPELFGEIAALYVKVGDYRNSLYYLRRAFELFPNFSFWTRRQAIANAIYAQAPRDVYQRELNVSLAGSCTTAFLRPFLLAAGLAREMKLNIYEADFGVYAQEILNPESGLYKHNPDAILLLLESHDFNCGLRAPQSKVDEYVAKIKNLRELALVPHSHRARNTSLWRVGRTGIHRAGRTRAKNAGDQSATLGKPALRRRVLTTEPARGTTRRGMDAQSRLVRCQAVPGAAGDPGASDGVRVESRRILRTEQTRARYGLGQYGVGRGSRRRRTL